MADDLASGAPLATCSTSYKSSRRVDFSFGRYSGPGITQRLRHAESDNVFEDGCFQAAAHESS